MKDGQRAGKGELEYHTVVMLATPVCSAIQIAVATLDDAGKWR